VERDEVTRNKYLKVVDLILKKNRVYIDESGIEHNMMMEHCWVKKGAEVIGEKEGGKRGRTSVIAALNEENINAPMTYSGTMNGALFLRWLKCFLVPSLTSGQVVIMDNASIHKVAKVEEIINDAGCSLLYLPPYSPDFNPIENYWAVMKSQIRKVREKFENIEDTIDSVLMNKKRYFNT